MTMAEIGHVIGCLIGHTATLASSFNHDSPSQLIFESAIASVDRTQTDPIGSSKLYFVASFGRLQLVARRFEYSGCASALIRPEILMLHQAELPVTGWFTW
jgi:hypothetical protein